MQSGNLFKPPKMFPQKRVRLPESTSRMTAIAVTMFHSLRATKFTRLLSSLRSAQQHLNRKMPHRLLPLLPSLYLPQLLSKHVAPAHWFNFGRRRLTFRLSMSNQQPHPIRTTFTQTHQAHKPLVIVSHLVANNDTIAGHPTKTGTEAI